MHVLTRSAVAALALLPALVLPAPAPASAAGPTALPDVLPGVQVPLRGSGRQADSLVPARRSSLRSAGSAATATFSVTYTGFTSAQRDAFQAAVDTWARLVTSPVPIKVDATISRLPPGVLGSAGATAYVKQDANRTYGPEDTYVPVALANRQAGRDLLPSQSDITADFASDTSLFSYGPDPVEGKYDFTTVVLHEIGHGLGFAGDMEVLTDSAGVDRGYWAPGDPKPSPFPYDRFTATPRSDGTLTPLLDLQRGSTALAAALTTGRSVWTGSGGEAGNGGRPVELYTPAQWEEGSSYSHLDENTYPTGDPDSLMTPVIDYGELIRDPGDIALGMLADTGWATDTSPVRLTGPSSVVAGTKVAVTGVAPAGSTVQLYFHRRGQTSTSPGAPSGYTLQRVLTVGSDARFATTYVATDDHRYVAQVGSTSTPGVLTQVRPVISGPAVRRVPRGTTVTLTGRSLPGTRLALRFTRGTEVDVTRTVTVAANGTWSRSQVLTGDLRVYATAANGQRSDGTVLLQVA